MNTEWVFDSEGVCDNAYVENSRDNTSAVRFSLVLNDEPDKVIFRSPKIPVGGRYTRIQVNEPLPEGTSKGTVIYSLLDSSDKVTGEVKAGVTVVNGR